MRYKKYFANFPFDEKVVRKVLAARLRRDYSSDIQTFENFLSSKVGSFLTDDQRQEYRGLINHLRSLESVGDSITGELSEYLTPPDSSLDGNRVRLLSLTVGPGEHHIYGKTYNVPEGQVYATIDTIEACQGTISTYNFKIVEERLEKLGEFKRHCIS